MSRECFKQLPAALLLLAAAGAQGADFSVTPIRADLKPGALTETITVTNDSAARLRVGVKLMEWTQDAAGNDVYKDSGDLVYFPRQMDIEPAARRLVRIGAKNPGTGGERAYRLFIEEIPDPNASASTAVTFYFRFGVPVFVPPASGKAELRAADPVLDKGRISVQVSNLGNQHFRLAKVTIGDGAGYQQDLAGWYSLAGTTRTYAVDVPRDICRAAKVLYVRGEGEGVSFERRLDVEPARCA